MEKRLILSSSERGSLKEGLLPALARGLALFLGGFSLLNLAGDFLRAGFDANLWWLDLRSLPQYLATFLLLFISISLVSFAVSPPRTSWRRGLILIAVGLAAGVALWNAGRFYKLYFMGSLHSAMPVPFSLLVFGAMLLVLRVVLRPPQPGKAAGTPIFMSAAFVGCLFAFPLAQMLWFGETDYRRPADVAVVFGARTYRDGRPSDALADRVRTACDLYRQGLVKKLLMSGGPGDGAVHETEAMRTLAVKLGVKPEDIITDTEGVNTQATVRNSQAIFGRLHAQRVLVVSHFYHLPRIKMAYQRAGWDVYTVPARESYYLRQTPYFMAREVAALWAYYFRPLVA